MTILAKARGKTPTGVVRSGVGSGGAGSVLPPVGIAPALGRLAHSAHKRPGRGYATEDFDKIFEILRTATGIDFQDYRRSSIVRRILRQMALHGVATLAQYAKLLRRDHKEMESLADQVFVPFTGFFRDPESFEALRNRIRRKLQRKQRANTLRVWVAGCSTGEEVYSIAMLLLEELELSTNRTTIQVFGTDIRASSLQHARAGVYPQAAIADLSPAHLERFFIKSEEGYRISPQARDLCVFALHDLTKHPPFSNLDLISCRNVLPYLKPSFQNQALTAFHSALKPRALLFTDSAIVAKGPGQYTVKDRKHGILSRMPDKRKAHGRPRSLALPRRKGSVSGVTSTQADLLPANEQLSAASLITSQEEERRRLARDIHDSLCQHLGALAAELGDVIADVPASSPGGQRLRTAREHALATAEEARQIARQLHPAILEDLGLPKALQNLCEEFRHQVGIPVKFRLLGQHRQIPIEAAFCVYRIAQEAFNNIARHAHAKNVTVVLNRRRDLHFSIRDDGAGFNPGTVHGSGGLGLVSMRERARLANGELTVAAKPGQGTRVELVLHSPGRAS